MKVCFVEPAGVHKGLNTGLGYLCASIQEEKRVFDFNNNPKDVEQRLDEISKHDIIGFSLKSLNVSDATNLGKRVKNKNNILIAEEAIK